MRGNVSCKLSTLLLAASTAVLSACGGSETDALADASAAPPASAPAPGTPPGDGSVPAPTPQPAPTPAPGTTPAPGGDGDPVTADAFATCAALPPLPSKPADARSVRDFGVRGDGSDETTALQRAIDSLRPGQWLVFPAGRYVHSKSLQVKVPGAVLWSEGATLHATNPEDQAVWLMANGASVYNFTMTAITNGRKTAPWHSRIAVFAGVSPRVLLKDNVIRGNRVISSGAAGTPGANSSGSAGIFLFYANRFLVAENTVQRSLADAIHITAGSHDGRVLKNTVREPGDDMIAMVSYIGSPTKSGAQVAAEIDRLRPTELVHDVLVGNNDVSGQYWGRGITVVGGENVTIQANTIDRTTHGAAVYLARETSYLTYGVRNVLVRDNRVSRVQTTAPAYTPPGQRVVTTGHGAFEIYSWLFTDEAANPALRDKLAVQSIQVEGNTVDDVRTNVIRIGNGWGRTWGQGGRSVTGGNAGLINLERNTLSNAGGTPLAILNQPSASYNVRCNANTYNGQSLTAAQCGGAHVPVTGARISACS